MRVAAFDFELPRERIALRPAVPRRAARMLVVDSGGQTDSRVTELPRWLRTGDLLVFNDTRVLPVRLHGRRQRAGASAAIGVTLLREGEAGCWESLARPLRRLRAGDRVDFGGGLEAAVRTVGETRAVLNFSAAGAAFSALLQQAGAMPLPPYLGREPDARDREDYQTVFAQHPGAVAAPTAGLHFDQELLRMLDEAGISRVGVTLHVGGGTFLPVRSERVEDHALESEWGEVGPAAAAAIRKTREAGGRVVAVGTTALRLLETAARAGRDDGSFAGSTGLFIYPGFAFRAADALLTNFHLPRSTLFMLVCAFLGTGRMKAAYRHAVAAEYRFFSYGDATLLLRGGAGDRRP